MEKDCFLPAEMPVKPFKAFAVGLKHVSVSAKAKPKISLYEIVGHSEHILQFYHLTGSHACNNLLDNRL